MKKQNDLSFENFNDFIYTMQSVRWVALNSETCNCSIRAKNFIGKHIISISKMIKLFET